MVKRWRNVGSGSPPCADGRDQGLQVLALLLASSAPSSRIAAVEDQPVDAIRVPKGVGDGGRRSLGYPEQDEPVEANRVDNRLEVAHPAVQRQRFRFGVGKAASPLVVANEGVPLAQALEPVTPDGTLPVELEVREPVRGLYDRRTAAVLGPREPHSVGCGAEANLLLHRSGCYAAPVAARQRRTRPLIATAQTAGAPSTTRTGSRAPLSQASSRSESRPPRSTRSRRHRPTRPDPRFPSLGRRRTVGTGRPSPPEGQ
jgi:hypothetical protein